MKILVGSKNPVKIESVKEAFAKLYENIEVEGISVESNVPDQPLNKETFEGARNRALELRKLQSDADFFVGIEGGIADICGTWFSFGAVHIINKDGKEGKGTSPHFLLPDKVIKRLQQREELGIIMDEITKESNTKQKGGAIGFFTNGVMTRKELYVGGIITALIPFQHPNLF
ncbi:inosine/xanthosine triphosphatase [Candidatus Woesearchaeota archaeon]|jgi:inosine/xanthosine triphosphatase|nr:inosine/xanthosine triphosphatase [Candidatus Woesearchaeota archaeon]MBT3538224.1 inosine/xanthosine triphosphatase [Candidatus Woesearchaeota archaeon]MBT4696733.1 inosine/xanthosine triphosphatase [Candidatus Woesearchaeota archaeon]MBT4717241.1 inosine/xanthosine triphosphatase [Candidatus Woesearchaeota archaeon]MBT7105893.1 inosine/xanthosine triphosphatase [Candidatus Woesearchaeota archaeon]